MRRLYYSPSAPKGGYGNPYSVNYKTAMGRYYNIVDKVGMQAGASFCLLCHSFMADVYVFNWIESISGLRFGKIQYWIVRLCFLIIKRRKAKVVWMLHNMHPHAGGDKYSESIMSYLFGNADLIVSHSKAATAFARGKAKGRVEYMCHPVAQAVAREVRHAPAKPCDVLIWGDISPYKGVLELISDKRIRESGLKFLIVGKCYDAKLLEQITPLCTGNICYENRRADYDELAVLVSGAKYVLFPYLHSSVSSSGALMDTIALGGVPVGPRVGAFGDLAEDGVCLVYDNIDELLKVLLSGVTIDEAKRGSFISSNTWDAFADKMNELLKELA